MYTLKFGGGLGDVINQIYTKGTYQFLELLNKDDLVNIILICSNPYAHELFKYHPKVQQFIIHNFNWWPPEQEVENLTKHHLPLTEHYIKSAGEIKLYTSMTDSVLLDTHLETIKNSIIFSMGAGEVSRNVPDEIIHTAQHQIKAAGLNIIRVGRDFTRFNRTEPEFNADVDFVNLLSVPGTIELLKRSKGLFTCHSALNIAAWHNNIPQLVLYPESVQQRHFLKTDEWSFGKDYKNTFHGLFAEYENKLKQFINYVTTY